jgi:hypothetical protein
MVEAMVILSILHRGLPLATCGHTPTRPHALLPPASYIGWEATLTAVCLATVQDRASTMAQPPIGQVPSWRSPDAETLNCVEERTKADIRHALGKENKRPLSPFLTGKYRAGEG